MIRKYTHKNVDKNRYTELLQKSANYRIYAELWYLDIVSPDGYDIWVLEDYQAVMPVPYQTKLKFTFVSQPVFCQQLGVFYEKSISQKEFYLFFKELSKYKVRSYSFNEENKQYFSTDSALKEKNNQILELNNSYSEIYSRFNSNRKRELHNVLQRNFFIEEKFDIEIIKSLIQDNSNIFTHKNNLLIERLLKKLNLENLLKQITFKNKRGEVLGVLILLISNKRLISLLPLRSKTGEKGIITCLYNYVMKKYSEKDLLLDFEGSMLSGVAKFNCSFGSESRQYITYKNFKWFELFKK